MTVNIALRRVESYWEGQLQCASNHHQMEIRRYVARFRRFFPFRHHHPMHATVIKHQPNTGAPPIFHLILQPSQAIFPIPMRIVDIFELDSGLCSVMGHFLQQRNEGFVPLVIGALPSVTFYFIVPSRSGRIPHSFPAIGQLQPEFRS